MCALIFVGLMGFSFLTSEHADAGSAVALAAHNQLATAYGGPIRKKSSERLPKRFGDTARLLGFLAATDVTGYGAIAVARHPNGNWVIGVSLGNRSATEADTLAIQHCLRAGGVNPQVKWGFRG